MKKYGFLSSLLYICFGMMFLYVDGDDGGGGADNMADDGADGIDNTPDDLGNHNIDDNDIDDDQNITVPKDEWERTQRVIKDIETKNAFDEEVAKIKSEIPDFDEKIVLAEIRKIYKEDPDKAEKYNSAAGFENLWNKIQADAVKNDETNSGSFKGEDSAGFDSLMEDVQAGKRGALGKALDKSL